MTDHSANWRALAAVSCSLFALAGAACSDTVDTQGASDTDSSDWRMRHRSDAGSAVDAGAGGDASAVDASADSASADGAAVADAGTSSSDAGTSSDAGPIVSGSGRTFYVDGNNPQASDGNAGTSATAPWKTLQKAASTMVAGDTVNINAGTYDEAVTMQSAGTAAARITYHGYGGSVVMPQALTVSKDYTTVSGIEVSGDSMYIDGSYCEIVGNYVHHSGAFGMFIHGSHNIVRGNKVANNGSSWGGQVTTGWGDAGGYLLFENNDVSDPEGRGEDLMQYMSHDVIIRNNAFHHLGSNGRHNDCYQSAGGEYNIWMINNTFTDLNEIQYYMTGSGDKDHVWRGNLFWGFIGWGFNGSPSGMRVVNNTFGTAAGGYGYGGDGFARNNIYYDWGTQIPYGAQSADYDLIAPIPTWGVTRQPHDLWGVEPGFVDFAGRDFHLAAGSPCIDAGVFMTTTTAAGSGTALPVADAQLFVDGLGLGDGDTIQLQGQTQTAKITRIDYASNVLTLDKALTWSSGQGVHLPYNGPAPDLGAYEH